MLLSIMKDYAYSLNKTWYKFDNFYFSRTRKSLEHYYPQSKAGEDKVFSDNDINCFGNFAMISTDANSSGSNWDPKTKQRLPPFPGSRR